MKYIVHENTKANVPIQSSNMYSEHIFSPTFLRQVLLLKCSLPNDVIFILISLVLKYTYNYCTKYLFSIMHQTMLWGALSKRDYLFFIICRKSNHHQVLKILLKSSITILLPHYVISLNRHIT